MGYVTSDNYATTGHESIFESGFCSEVTIFLKSLKGLMANWKRYTLEMKMLIDKLKLLICRWMNKEWLTQNSVP